MKPTLRWILFVSGLTVCFATGGPQELQAQNAPNTMLANIDNSYALTTRRDDKAPPPVPKAKEKTAVASGVGQFSAVTLADCLSELSDQEDMEKAGLSKPAEQSFKLFPNPARGYVLVQILKQLNTPFQVLVMSDNGACKQELRCSQGKAGDEWIVNTEDLLPGIYFLRINTGMSTLIRKVNIF